MAHGWRRTTALALLTGFAAGCAAGLPIPPPLSSGRFVRPEPLGEGQAARGALFASSTQELWSDLDRALASMGEPLASAVFRSIASIVFGESEPPRATLLELEHAALALEQHHQEEPS